MPSRGYRKGVSDTKTAKPRPLLAYVSATDKSKFEQSAAERGVSASQLLATYVTAHLTGTRAELPHKRGPSSQAVRDLARIGNNLNQLARQANAGIIPVREAELQAVLKDVLATVARV